MPCSSFRRETAAADRPRPAHRLIHWLLLVLVALPASPQRTDLDRIRGDIEELREKLEGVRRQTESAERELQEADLELGIRTSELELAAAAETELLERRSALTAEIAALTPRIERQKAELRKRLVALYRMGGLSYLRIILAIEDDRSPLEAMSMLSYLVSRDGRLVARFQTTRQDLARSTVELAAKQIQLQETRAIVEQRRRAVAAAVVQKRRMLSRLRTAESGAEEQLAALEEKAKRLQRLLDVLSKQKGGIDPAIDIRTVQGALDWPVRGKVVERFGRQRNPKFATFTINNGIRIEAAPGTPVLSVFQGTVLFSQWFKGYGNLIILDHGNRVFSLYGNLKAPSVAVGDRIVAGQPIAGVAEGEEGDSGHLYFEMRQENHPEDPLKWLR